MKKELFLSEKTPERKKLLQKIRLLPAKGLFHAVLWEIRMELSEALQYKTGLLMDALLLIGSFLAALFLGSGSSLSSFYQADGAQSGMLLLIGYLFWGNSCAALGCCTGALRGEMQEGTFELRLQSRFPLTLMLFCQLLADTLLHFLIYGSLLAAAALFSGSSLADVRFLFLSLPVLLPCLAGMYGMGLLAGAVGLHAKKTGSLIFLIQTALLFVTNTLTPSAAGPLFLIPFCPGIDIARSLYLYGSASAGACVTLLCVNFAWLLLGNIVFSFCLKRERKYGTWDTW